MTTPDPLVTDSEIASSVEGILENGAVVDVEDVRLLMASLRDHYEAIFADLLARVAKLELDSIYLHEVASPAIGQFQEQARQQKARIAALEAKLAGTEQP